MTRYRNCFLAFTLLLVASCGGGGGGGGGGAAPSPSVTVSGVKANYWQDETIAISFSVANMDRTTVNYSISGLDEGYDFTLDSKAGTFRTVSDQYTDAGEYSYTVTATDGSGKTASRSFQFRVDAVVTGSRLFYKDERSLVISRSRDGLTAIFDAKGDFDVASLGVRIDIMICFGETSVNGAAISGTLNCGGRLFTPSGFETVSRAQIETDVNDQGTGSIVFFGSDGAQVAVWSESEGYSEEIEDFRGWPTNTEIPGRYLNLAIAHQYHYVYSFEEVDVGQLSTFDSIDRFVMPDMIIGSDYKIVTEVPASNTSACVFNGEIGQLALDEYNLVHGDKGENWRNSLRLISGELQATNCSDVGVPFLDASIDQPLGPFLAELNRTDGGGLLLLINGSGVDRPFLFAALKVSD